MRFILLIFAFVVSFSFLQAQPNKVQFDQTEQSKYQILHLRSQKQAQQKQQFVQFYQAKLQGR